MADAQTRIIVLRTNHGNYKVKVPVLSTTHLAGMGVVEIHDVGGSLIGMFGGVEAFHDFELVSSERTV